MGLEGGGYAGVGRVLRGCGGRYGVVRLSGFGGFKGWERRVLASGDLCITVIQDPEPESKGGDVGLNLVSILPILSLIRSYAKVSLRGNNGRGVE